MLMGAVGGPFPPLTGPTLDCIHASAPLRRRLPATPLWGVPLLLAQASFLRLPQPQPSPQRDAYYTTWQSGPAPLIPSVPAASTEHRSAARLQAPYQGASPSLSRRPFSSTPAATMTFAELTPGAMSNFSNVSLTCRTSSDTPRVSFPTTKHHRSGASRISLSNLVCVSTIAENTCRPSPRREVRVAARGTRRMGIRKTCPMETRTAWRCHASQQSSESSTAVTPKHAAVRIRDPMFAALFAPSMASNRHRG
mmetsp:Transcript_59701/g.159759  ORF Transcript_59701/g.159759 Transcript_59701/m.159759 type:complete len:252 (-) Transcript_59701:14-769(-)